MASQELIGNERKKQSNRRVRINQDLITRASNLFDRGFDFKSRTLYLGTQHYSSEGHDLGVDPLMAEQLIKGLYLLNQSGNQSIRIITNNPGGNTIDGMAIYDAILASPASVDIEVFGQASSIGAVILQAGRKRLLHQNTIVLIHDGYILDIERTPVRSKEAWSMYTRKDRERMYRIFAERSGRPEKFWQKACAHDTIWYAEEAVKYGLADAII